MNEQMQSVCPWAAKCETEASRIAALIVERDEALIAESKAIAELAKVKAECKEWEEAYYNQVGIREDELKPKIARLEAERDAAVARLRYLYDDTMSKLIWHDKPPISFDQYAFNIDAALEG